jgi:Helix-turn-helix domain
MSKRRPNHRLVKIHRNYSVEEVARLLNIHKNTVRQWVKSGLPTIDDKRPILIRGRELIAFLQIRRAGRKQPCRAGQMYCVRCRCPQFPAAGMVEYRPLNGRVANVRGICPDCNSMMHRCVSMARIEQFVEKADITFPQALRHIGEISRPTVNSDFKGDVQP